MEGIPGTNKNIISNKRVFIGRLSLYSFWTDVSEDFPFFFRVQKVVGNILYSIDDEKTKNIFSTRTSTEKEDETENYYKLPSLTLVLREVPPKHWFKSYKEKTFQSSGPEMKGWNL